MLGVVLAFFISIYIIWTGFKDYSRCLWGIYSLVLIVPLSSVAGLDTISLLKVGSVGVLEIAIIELFIIKIVTSKHILIKKQIIPLLIFLVFGIYIVYMIASVNNGRAVSDFKDYLIPVLLFFCFEDEFAKHPKSIMRLVETTLQALRINAFLIFLIYIFYWLPHGLSGRFGFTAETLYVFSIPMQIVQLFGKDMMHERKLSSVLVGTVVQILLVFISQTRTIIIAIIIILIVSAIFEMRKTENFLRQFFVLMIIIGMAVSGYYFLITHKSSQVGWIHRMAEIMQVGINTDSNNIRKALFAYYIPEIYLKPLGHGFGSYMPVWEQEANGLQTLISGETMGVDNLFLTYAFKIGIAPFLLYSLIHLISLWKIWKSKLVNHTYEIMPIALTVLLIPTAIMSVQILKNLTIACFDMVFIAWSVFLKNSILQNEEEMVIEKND